MTDRKVTLYIWVLWFSLIVLMLACYWIGYNHGRIDATESVMGAWIEQNQRKE